MDKSELEQQAELLFPYPEKACRFIKAKINWQRERWILESLNNAHPETVNNNK